MEGLVALDDLLKEPNWVPRCVVCREPLGQAVSIDIMGTDDGGEYGVTCYRGNAAHCVGVERVYECEAGVQTAVMLKHIGNKPWCNPEKLFAVLWPWLGVQDH